MPIHRFVAHHFVLELNEEGIKGRILDNGQSMWSYIMKYSRFEKRKHLSLLDFLQRGPSFLHPHFLTARCQSKLFSKGKISCTNTGEKLITLLVDLIDYFFLIFFFLYRLTLRISSGFYRGLFFRRRCVHGEPWTWLPGVWWHPLQFLQGLRHLLSSGHRYSGWGQYFRWPQSRFGVFCCFFSFLSV